MIIKVLKNVFLGVGLVSVFLVGVPLLIGCVVSGNSFTWINVDSQWIGFWGNYIGAIIGGLFSGVVAIYVMKHSLEQEKREQGMREKISFCYHINELVLNYASKIGNYQIDCQEKGIEDNSILKEWNELVEIGGNIVGLLYTKAEDDYSGVDIFIEKLNVIMGMNDEYSKINIESDRTVLGKEVLKLSNELRKYSIEFVNDNIKGKTNEIVRFK